MEATQEPKNEEQKNPDLHQEESNLQIGPNPRKLRKIDLHELLLSNLPCADNYEISYMHRDIINHIVVSNKCDMIVTISVDGHIKFWKKVFQLVEFIKNYKAHNGLVVDASLSKNHQSLCTVGIDKTLKIFDTYNADLRAIIKLSFVPSACEFLPRKGFDLPLIAISEEKLGKIQIIDIEKQQRFSQQDEDNEVLTVSESKKQQTKQSQKENSSQLNVIKTLNIHRHPIKFLKMNWVHNFCISIDERCFLEVWNPQTYDLPENTKYKSKIETDFLQLIQQNSIPVSLEISAKGNLVGIMLKDRTIRVFNLITGKSVVTINESIKEITRIQEEPTHERHAEEVLDEAEFQKKINIEKDIEISKDFFNAPHLDFDESEEFLIYPSFRGIKIYSLSRKCIENILGKKEHERFIKVYLYQGRVMRNPSGTSNAGGERKGTDPTLFCTSFRRPRFYIFSRRSPEIGPENDIVRDIVNERQIKDDQKVKDQIKLVEQKSQITLHTTMGDITVELFLEDFPKTCENFIQLCRKGFYNNVIFHRVIKGFMNQTGCPKGDGTGGQSIWGGFFEDELKPEKYRFDRPYMLAMANRGPNTNGSQFFITVVACPWLNNKHTVFGRVIKGIETVCQINGLKTDKTEKPLINVKIISTTIK